MLLYREFFASPMTMIAACEWSCFVNDTTDIFALALNKNRTVCSSQLLKVSVQWHNNNRNNKTRKDQASTTWTTCEFIIFPSTFFPYFFAFRYRLSYFVFISFTFFTHSKYIRRKCTLFSPNKPMSKSNEWETRRKAYKKNKKKKKTNKQR